MGDPEQIEEGSASWEMRNWILHWYTWVENYRELGYHDLPAQIPLSVIMQESRGSPSARGAAGEIGLMQVLPSSAGARVAELEQSSKNLFHGIGLLESYTWEAHYYAAEEPRVTRDLRYESYPAASQMVWWESFEGWTTLAMYQCGPGNIENGFACGRNGGYRYAQAVLQCWVPWVETILRDNGFNIDDEAIVPSPSATITPEPSWTPTATAHATLSVRADRATVEPSPAPAVSKEDATDLASFFAALVGTAVILFIGHLLGMRRASRRK